MLTALANWWVFVSVSLGVFVCVHYVSICIVTYNTVQNRVGSYETHIHIYMNTHTHMKHAQTDTKHT